MEIHKDIKLDNKFHLSLTDNYLDFFSKALEFTKEYYSEDMNRISSTIFSEITPEHFFREYIWCVYTSGFNAKIVSKLFPALLEVYSPLEGVFARGKTDVNAGDLRVQALAIVNNVRKVQSIIDTAFQGGSEIKTSGWVLYRDLKLSSPEKLEKLAYIGPITRYHLARNIGLLNHVKPDLHLVRMAKNWNFDNPISLCKSIQKEFDLPLGIIDLVLWYAASTFGTK